MTVLIRAAQDARADGRDMAIMRGASREVERALSLAGLDDVLPFTAP